MECERLQYDLAAQALTGLDESKDAGLTFHLGRCGVCRAERDVLSTVVTRLSAVFTHDHEAGRALWNSAP